MCHVDQKQEEAIVIDMDKRDRPVKLDSQPTTNASTQPTTRRVTTTQPIPTTEPIDPQLDAAVSSLIGHMVLQGERDLKK